MNQSSTIEEILQPPRLSDANFVGFLRPIPVCCNINNSNHDAFCIRCYSTVGHPCYRENPDFLLPNPLVDLVSRTPLGRRRAGLHMPNVTDASCKCLLGRREQNRRFDLRRLVFDLHHFAEAESPARLRLAEYVNP